MISENYKVTKEAKVWSKLGKRWLRGSVRGDGYRVQYINGGLVYEHRLVWEYFNGAIPSGLEINHKDGNRQNNELKNLELVTRSENIKHSYEVLGRKTPTGKDHWMFGKSPSSTTKAKMRKAKLGESHPKFKGYYCFEGNRYPSAREAATKTGIDHRTVKRRALNHLRGWSFEQA